ncbi:MAG: pilus assembly protein [Rhodospirillaceae bacterium]|nr:pilus assembly protein [Rhodospirillaceae bacterium]
MSNKSSILKIFAERARVKKMPRMVQIFARSESGISAVEMALIAPVLMIIFLGLVDYGIAIFSKLELTSSVRAGAQYALINSTNMAAIQTTVINSSNLDPANLAVNMPYVTCECSNGTVDATCLVVCPAGVLRHYVVIDATYTYVPFFLPTNIVLNATSSIRVE